MFVSKGSNRHWSDHNIDRGEEKHIEGKPKKKTVEDIFEKEKEFILW